MFIWLGKKRGRLAAICTSVGKSILMLMLGRRLTFEEFSLFPLLIIIFYRGFNNIFCSNKICVWKLFIGCINPLWHNFKLGSSHDFLKKYQSGIDISKKWSK